MAGRVAWAESAWHDLEAAASYIARDSPRYAAAFVREMRDAARSLRQLPRRGRIVPELDDPSIRELIVRSYRLIYSVSKERVFVLAIVHDARDLRTIWSTEHRSEARDE